MCVICNLTDSFRFVEVWIYELEDGDLIKYWYNKPENDFNCKSEYITLVKNDIVQHYDKQEYSMLMLVF
jgi:hypothetical protein